MKKPIIGLIGLGEIGGGMAASAVRSGHAVIGYDISDAALERAQNAGVTSAKDRAYLIENSDIIVTSLASVAALENSYFSADGVFNLARAGQAVIECSTVSPDFARRLSARSAELNLIHTEAAVVGVGKDADAGGLFYLASGASEPAAAALSFFDATGRGNCYLGVSGAAAIAKVLNNAIGYSTIVAIAEALALARRYDIDTDKFVESVIEANGSGASVAFSRHAARMAGLGEGTKASSPIGLKDAIAMADVVAGVAGNCPTLCAMIDTYQRALPNLEVDNQVAIARQVEAQQTTPNAGDTE